MSKSLHISKSWHRCVTFYQIQNDGFWPMESCVSRSSLVHQSFLFFGFLKAESLYFQLWISSLIAVPFSIAPCQSSKHKHHGFKKCLQFREVPPVNPADISAQEPLSGVRLFLFLCSSSRLSPSQGRKNTANCNLLTAWNPPAAMMSILISGIPRQAESVHLF